MWFLQLINMENLIYFILLAIVLVAVGIAIQKIIRQRKEADILRNRLKKQLPCIDKFLEGIGDLNEIKSYISYYQLYSFRRDFTEVYEYILNTTYSKLSKFDNEKVKLDNFISTYKNLEEFINKKNKKFVEKELQEAKELLGNIEGKSLDWQQRKSIIINEDNQLVIAGAGSGKTTTIAGKVKYLIERCNIKEEEILLLSYTRKAADEMQERIRDKMNINIGVKTFHKLGMEIIAESNNEKPNVYDGYVLERLEGGLLEAQKDSKYLAKLVEYLSYYLKPYKSMDEFDSNGEYEDYLKENKLRGFKMLEHNGVKYPEKYKSQEEVIIANFLFRNGIEYKYEERYKYKTASKEFGTYKPDFYLPEYDLYIEHFGIDKNGKVPSWFKSNGSVSAQESYTKGIEWKRSEHRQNGTTLVETYSWEQQEGQLIDSLTKKLEDRRVKLNPKNDEEMLQYIIENEPTFISDFTKTVSSFLNLFKTDAHSFDELKELAKEKNDERAFRFFELFEPLFIGYETSLRAKDEIDFNDMIIAATKAVKEDIYENPFKFIVIDEFQDISISRYNLIKALVDQAPDVKLFCVGDDWQSIYRFAGSDIGVMTDFEEHFKSTKLEGFKRKTHRSYIETTYRFSEEMIKVSTDFILKNPKQIKKTLRSSKKLNLEPLSISKYSENFTVELSNIFKEIFENGGTAEKDVLLLGRYTHDKNELEKSKELRHSWNKIRERHEYKHREFPNLNISFSTVHSAKGLEADVVIILNGKSGTHGFPSEISDDPLLDFLLSKADQFPNGEERRLFYVALTRTREKVYLLAEENYPSKFMLELGLVQEEDDREGCAWCDNGRLVKRKGPFGAFLSCDNHSYCNYTRKILEAS